jgi:cellulose synthase/poly-beta-1,6-N-acetylglucosamine synthase-like glycosyltransferase/peptidoglycan/xylan/chitin deacetylase (PgdA/CDA1 family)/spore germination protein YaaH
MQNPIFYDPSGKRKKASLIGLLTLIGLGVLLAVGLFISILIVPVPQGLDLHMEYPRYQAWKIKYNRATPRHVPLQVRGGHDNVNQTIAAFYAYWDDASRLSLEKHINNIDMVLPVLASVTGPGHTYSFHSDDKFRQLMLNAQHKPTNLLVVQNSALGVWDALGTAKLLASETERRKLIAEVEGSMRGEHSDGVTFDFEAFDQMPAGALQNYLTFIKEAHAVLGKDGFLVTLTVPVDTDTWNLRAFAGAADRLFLMIYDEHSGADPAGPIASQSWFNERLAWALKQVPPAKAIVCIGNYGYDWYTDKTGRQAATPDSVEEAWRVAYDSDAQIQFDPVSGNPYFLYVENGVKHEVWFLDAVSAWNQLKTVDDTAVSGVALWRLGYEDPAIWPAFRKFQTNDQPDLTRLSGVGDVDIEGSGEVLHIDATPTDGKRTVTFDKNNVAQSEQYQTLPTGYVVRRPTTPGKRIALTFDDGPDGRWTPTILNILKDHHINATFFVIGEKAIDHPELLRQMVREGNELGNHSYTHPDMSKIPEWQIRLELNSTQRVVEAYTGRSMRLVRPPYFGDAEPTDEDELVPALIGQRLGYTNVGLHVDSEDWQKPGVQAIIKNVLDGVNAGTANMNTPACKADPTNSDCRTGQIILMHDSGGIRTQTIAALPTIIETLQKEGYQFVTVGELLNLGRDQVMPQLTGDELMQVRFDVGLFLFLASLNGLLKWLFIIAIFLGITRALMLAALAIYAEYTGHMEPPDGDQADFVKSAFVSVVIPAYNEAKVIEASVRRVLASTGVNLEVIVVDDGSKDGTSDVMRAAFAGEPRVHLITQANAGKAAAVNNGIRAAKGEIIIALDADTQFEAETISRLVRWFVRPEIGAVAGNAKVGNRFNFVTRWQAVEYVTSQNLERSALAMFGAMMVVPGAVGAWRRSALAEVGNYPENTLAEDQDLTIAIQRKGWKVAYDQDAVAWTESPESFGALMKQRFRWAFGTLQCLWKHQKILKTHKPKGLALIGVPQAWIFQIGFSVISPLIDFALVVNIIGTIVRVYQHGWAETDSDLSRMLVYWIAFLLIDAICGAIAYWLEPREKSYPVFWLLSQRFVYRQIMYYVVIKALMAAWRGKLVGWGKLERSGRLDKKAQAGTGVTAE